MTEASGDTTNYNSPAGKIISFRGATFTKAERLCSKKIIASLFTAGQSFSIPPFRCVYLKTELPSDFPVQITISVPKKYFPRAVDRNHIRRMVREVYRNNKNELYQHLAGKNIQVAAMIIYTAKTITTFNEVENKIKITLKRLIREYDVVA
ncbi:MAG: ribonuclease P protein component [Chitinophagales bacterium]|nr:ribonuclease P protein component [Chitinophagales bacterium]